MTLDLPHDKALYIIAGVLIYAAAHFVSPVVGLGFLLTERPKPLLQIPDLDKRLLSA